MCEVEAPQLQQQEPSVLLLGDEGGLWHVDGLLELLAGALCAALGADPSSLSLSPDDCIAASAIVAAQALGREAAPDMPPPPSRTASQLTEANLSCRAERGGGAGAGPAEDDEDDRASVASLSAWVAGTHSPRRRGSEVGALLTGGSPRTPSSLYQAGPFTSPLPAFSFSAVGDSGPRTCPTSGGGTGLLDGSDPRWPRRRLSTGGGRQ